MATRESELTEIFDPIIRSLGCGLWGLEYINQGKHSILRVYLEKEGGVDIEDCANVSKQLSSILDVEDPITGEYTLEVSSPGMDRRLFTLEQYNAYLGCKINLRLTESFEGRRNFTGLLESIIDEEVLLIVDNEKYTLPYELIEKANIES